MMRIQRALIERFGILCAQEIEGFSSGCNIFIGPNEAGKSTMWNFFKAMFFGYVRGKTQLDPLIVETRKSAQAGGTLFLSSKNAGLITLMRRPKAGAKKVELYRGAGEQMLESEFNALLGYLTPEVFDNVFAFNLQILMNLASLNGAEVRHALHGAAFGLGKVSPSAVLKQLGMKADSLLKQEKAGVSAPINDTWRELEIIQRDLAEYGRETEQYFAAQDALQLLREQVDGLAEQRLTLLKQARRLERYLALWPHFEELLMVKTQLQDLEGISRREDGSALALAPNALHQMDSLCGQYQEKTAEQAGLEQSLVELRDRCRSLEKEAVWRKFFLPVQSLREQIESCRKDSERIGLLWQNILMLRQKQLEDLARFHWDEQDVFTVNVSLQTKESMHAAKESAAALWSEVNVAEKELERLRRERLFAQSVLDAEPTLGGNDESDGLPDIYDLELLSAKLALAESKFDEWLGLKVFWLEKKGEIESCLSALYGEKPQQFWQEFVLPGQMQTVCRTKSNAALEAGQLVLQAGAFSRRQEIIVQESEDDLQRASEEMACFADQPDAETLTERAVQLERFERELAARQSLRLQFESVNDALAEILIPRHVFLDGLQQVGRKLLSPGLFSLLCGIGLFLSSLWEPWGFARLWAAIAGGISLVLLFVYGMSRTTLLNKQGDFNSFAADALKKQRAYVQSLLEQQNQDLADLTAQLEVWASVSDDVSEPSVLRDLRLLLDQQRARQPLFEQAVRKLAECEQKAQLAREVLVHAKDDESVAAQEAAKWQAEWCLWLESVFFDPGFVPEDALFILEQLERLEAAVDRVRDIEGLCAATQKSIEDCVCYALNLPFISADLKQFFGEQGSRAQGALLSGAEEKYEELFCRPSRHGEFTFARLQLPVEQAETLILSAEQQGVCGGNPVFLFQRIRNALRQVHEEHEQRRGLETRRSLHEEKLRQIQRLDLFLEQIGEELTEKRLRIFEEQTQWAAWLQTIGFPRDLSPDTALEAYGAVLLLRERFNDLALAEKELSSLCRSLFSFYKKIDALAVRAGFALPEQWQELQCLSQDDLDPEKLRFFLQLVFPVLDKLTDLVEKGNKAQSRLDALQEQSMAAEQRLALSKKIEQKIQADLQVLFDQAGVKTAEAFHAVFAAWQRASELRLKEQEHSHAFIPLAREEGRSVQNLFDELAESNPVEMRQKLEQINADLHDCEARMTTLAEQRGTLDARIQRLAEGDRAKLRQREQMLVERLGLKIKEWMVFSLARNLILAAKARVEKSGQSGVLGRASHFFSLITGGEYAGLCTGEEEEKFFAIHRNGALKDAERLSQGAKEQLYLSLRLAYIQNHAAHAEPVPVFMDDVLVNADPQRAKRIAALLGSFSLENQLLYFTCHPGTADLLYQAAVTASRDAPLAFAPACFSLESGEICLESGKYCG